MIDDIDLIDWWFYEAYPEFLKNGEIERISNFNDDGSIYRTFETSGDIYDYLQEKSRGKAYNKSISENQFVEIVDLIEEEDIEEEKINAALNSFGIDIIQESNYWIILMDVLKQTIDSDENVKRWSEAMYEYRKRGDEVLRIITITDNYVDYVIKNVRDLYKFIGVEE